MRDINGKTAKPYRLSVRCFQSPALDGGTAGPAQGVQLAPMGHSAPDDLAVEFSHVGLPSIDTAVGSLRKR